MFLSVSILLPTCLAVTVRFVLRPNLQQVILIQCLSLILLGAALATLATFNFAQALFVGVLASPLSFVRPLALPPSKSGTMEVAVMSLAVTAMIAISPPAVLFVSSHILKMPFHDMLVMAAWGWRIERVWTGITVWTIWWPAWVVGLIVLACGRTVDAAKQNTLR